MNQGRDVWRSLCVPLALLILVFALVVVAAPLSAGSTQPYYKRPRPVPQKESDFPQSDTYHTDLTNAHTDAFPQNPGDLTIYKRLFDARAAAVVRNAIGLNLGVEKEYIGQDHGVRIFADHRILEEGSDASELAQRQSLLEWKQYGDDRIYHVRSKALAVMAYPDYFPAGYRNLRELVSKAILDAGPGWCGTFGPGVDGTSDLMGKVPEGNYDMAQMHLLHLAYRYYEELTPPAREHLITQLLARGRIHRPGLDDTFTSGRTPDDWSRAGFVSPLGLHRHISETENHQLMIITARYLTNQLVYQRTPEAKYDNRRNGGRGRSNTMDIVLYLLRNMLRGDFSEYNAKNYQKETRWAVLNLANYAYDSEVRVAARMVLDYLSARMAVTSNDLRRIVPFRRRNEGKNSWQEDGFMTVGLLEWDYGADPLVPYFVQQAGNLRVFEKPDLQARLNPDGSESTAKIRAFPWMIPDKGDESIHEVMTDYRIPAPIHDLFVNDKHRRFYQRLHRVPWDENRGNRNCDNLEINASSPSYLITAGGKPCWYAIDPAEQALINPREALSQVGVAVPTTFMPTTFRVTATHAKSLVQFSRFSEEFKGVVLPRDTASVPIAPITRTSLPFPFDMMANAYLSLGAGIALIHGAENYCVAPDFVCGHRMNLPPWVLHAGGQGFTFVNMSSGPPFRLNRPGFYLAIYKQGEFALMEAFDTWHDSEEVTFEQFKERVLQKNPVVTLQSNVEADYRTQNGNRVRLVIWNNSERDETMVGAKIVEIDGPEGRTLRDDANGREWLHRGTILNSLGEAVIEISNPFLNTKIVLDMSKEKSPVRTAENGEVERGGGNNEVWVDFDWTQQSEGDFFRPYKTLSSAVAGVAEGGVVKITPGSTAESIRITRAMKLVAPIGGVTLGRR